MIFSKCVITNAELIIGYSFFIYMQYLKTQLWALKAKNFTEHAVVQLRLTINEVSLGSPCRLNAMDQCSAGANLTGWPCRQNTIYIKSFYSYFQQQRSRGVGKEGAKPSIDWWFCLQIQQQEQGMMAVRLRACNVDHANMHCIKAG